MDSDLLVKKLWDKIELIVISNGMELVDLEWISRNGRWTLCVYIDKESGVTLDDCELISREVSDLLDRDDPINNGYSLEVSSPGLDRPLRKNADFIRFAGEFIKVKTNEPVNGQKKFKGMLLELSTDNILLIKTEKEQEVAISLENVAKASLWYRFEKNDYKKGGIKKK